MPKTRALRAALGINPQASTIRSLQRDRSLPTAMSSEEKAASPKAVPETSTMPKMGELRAASGTNSEASTVRSSQRDESSPRAAPVEDEAALPEEAATPEGAANAIAALPVEESTAEGMPTTGDGALADALI